MHTYTALYDNRQDAEAAQQQLKGLGIIDADGMNLADQNTTGFSADRDQHNSQGFWGSLKGAFRPEDHQVYEEGVRQGGYLLTVNVDDQNAERVEDILERSNAVDINEREEQYRQTGLIPPTNMAASETTMGRTEGLAGQNEQAIPIVEEQLRVGKRQVERGGVRVRSYVVETPVQEQVTLRQEHVEVERRPVNQPLTGANMNADDLLRDRTIELTETSEEAVVAKEARVVEEVLVHKDVEQRTETIQDTVRHTEVDVDRLPGGTDTNRR